MAQKRPRKPRQDKPRPHNPNHRKLDNPRPPNDRGQGAKPFEPTPDQVRLVESAAGMGLRQDLICQLIINPKTERPIDKSTLERAFREQLDQGKAKAHFNVGKSLYDQAVGIPLMEVKTVNGKDVLVQTGWISEPDKIAAIWFSKAQMGWREGVKIEVTDLEAIVAGLGGSVEALRAARAAIPAEEG